MHLRLTTKPMCMYKCVYKEGNSNRKIKSQTFDTIHKSENVEIFDFPLSGNYYPSGGSALKSPAIDFVEDWKTSPC